MTQKKRFEATLLLSVSNLGEPAFLRKRLDEPLDGQRFVDTVLSGMVTEDGYQLKVSRDRTEVVTEDGVEITKIEFHGAILPDSITFEHLIDLFGTGWECVDLNAAAEKYTWIQRAIEEASIESQRLFEFPDTPGNAEKKPEPAASEAGG